MPACLVRTRQQLAPLARVPRVKLICLQKNFGTEQIAAVADEFPVITLQGLDEEGGLLLRVRISPGNCPRETV